MRVFDCVSVPQTQSNRDTLPQSKYTERQSGPVAHQDGGTEPQSNALKIQYIHTETMGLEGGICSLGVECRNYRKGLMKC